MGGRRLSEEERDARRTLRKARDLLNNQIEGYNDPDKFPVSDASKAVSHSYSISARYEAELDSIPEDDDFLLELDIIADKDYKDKTITLPEKKYYQLVKRNERLQAKINRVTILNALSRANRTLAQQMESLEKINELKKRTKYIDVQIHASILSAYNDMVYLALRRMGHSDKDIQDFADALKSLERDYPLVQMDKEDIIARLTGDSPIPVDAEYTVVEKNPHEKLRDVDKLL